MTTYTHNAHGTEVRIEDRIVGDRIIQHRMQRYGDRWVAYWRSSRPIHSQVREAIAARN
ncbi:hypothetical protein [Halioxenophilus aromaticivorans]|jgi:hypothetical protein|uniref:hypothetical protein n=1 Tax=Halioxenophilus aromaticivorans TaxID=1306992 RepID=UPI0031EE55DA